MALKNVQRVTFSLPIGTVLKLEMNIPKNRRSKFLAQILQEELDKMSAPTLEQTREFWKNFREKHPCKLDKTVEEIIREDRASH